MGELTLYGSPVSLYTGKARSYLIKAAIPYREVAPASAHFREVVRPRAGGNTIPVVELPDGRVIRDSTRIIDHFEALDPRFAPPSGCQRVVGLLFDVIGSEGLLRPAMHYRWDFPETNEAFLRRHFEMLAPRDRNAREVAEALMQRMRAASRAFGVTSGNAAGIESLYEGFLERLDAHFAASGYLLGGVPSIGDFGLIAPLYAHLGRDPHPLARMQAKAVHVFRWVERMNRPEPDTGELPDSSSGYRTGDEVPETLIDVLRQLARDFVPETRAAADCINRWLRARSPAPGTPIQRAVDTAAFEAEGMTIEAIAQPYRFLLLKRVQDAVAGLDEPARRRVTGLLSDCGMAPVLDARLDREIGWDGNREVWR